MSDLHASRHGWVALTGVGALKVVATLASVATTILLARLLGPAQLGVYAFALSCVAVVVQPVLQGLPTLALREVAAAGARRAEVARGITRFSDRVSAVVLVAALVLGVAARATLWPSLSLGTLAAAAAAVGVTLLMIAALVRGAVCRAHGAAAEGHVADLLVRPLAFLVALVMLASLPADRHSAWLAMSLHFGAALLAFGYAAHAMRRRVEGSGGGAVSPIGGGAWLGPMLSLSMVAGLQLVNAQVDVVVLGLLATPAEVGVYRVAAVLALQVSFVLTMVNSVVAPRFAELHRAGDLAGLQRANRQGARLAVAAGALIALGYALFGRQLIELTVGPGYLQAFLPLLVLTAAHLVTLYAGTTNVLLSMIGRERDVLRAGVAALVVNLGLSVALVPRLGMLGAALATAASLLAWRGTLSWMRDRGLALDAGAAADGRGG